jgi:hypothetical protein
VANLPDLPLDAEAEIECARNDVLLTRQEKFKTLFANPLARLPPPGGLFGERPPHIKMRAALLVDLRDYTGALFDAEARTIIKHAENVELLRRWFNSVAQRIQNEVTQETQNRHREHDFHCPIHERLKAIAGAVQGHAEYWIMKADGDPHSAISKLRAYRTQLEKENLVRANALLEPIREEAAPRYVRGRADFSGIKPPIILAAPVPVPEPAPVAPIPSRAARTFREPKMELLKNPDARLNRANAAEALGLSQRQFDRLVKARELVPVTLGHRKLFKTQDLRRILNQKKQDKIDKGRQG